jgi:glycosyltransferase involved in cell wall biosynthesis
LLYNSADGVILLSSAEGWGLSLTESLLTGTPFIANVTGGMQDQMRFVDENGNWLTQIPNFLQTIEVLIKNMVNGHYQFSQQTINCRFTCNPLHL